MPRPARPDDLYRVAVPYRPAPVAGRHDRRLHGQGASPGARRLPPGPSGPPRSTAPRPPAGSPSGRERTATRGSRRTVDRRVPLEPPAVGRGGAGRPSDARGARGRDPGPPPAARRRRGPPAHGPAARRDRLRLVARRHDARRPHELARRDRARRSAAARLAQAPSPARPAVRLPLPRPPRLPVQRAGLHRRHDSQLWLVDVATGAARPRSTDGRPPRRRRPGRRTAPGSRSPPNRGRNHDLDARSAIFVVDVATGEVTTVTGGADALFFESGLDCRTARSILAVGERCPRRRLPLRAVAVRRRRLRRGPRGGTDLLGGERAHARRSAMNSDVTIGEGAAGWSRPPTAPACCSPRRWTAATSCGGSRDGGTSRERLTTDRHYLSAFDAGRGRAAAARAPSSGRRSTDHRRGVVPDGGPRRATTSPQGERVQR